MQVKIHTISTDIGACISVTPVKKHGRAHYSGTVVLKDVDFSGFARVRETPYAVGTVVGEYEERHPLHTAEIPGPVLKRFRKVAFDTESGYFADFKSGRKVESTKVLYAVGREFFYLP